MTIQPTIGSATGRISHPFAIFTKLAFIWGMWCVLKVEGVLKSVTERIQKQAALKAVLRLSPDAGRGCRGGSRQSGDRRRRFYYTRRPKGRGNDLASKRSEAQPKTLLVFCRLKDPCWIRIYSVGSYSENCAGKLLRGASKNREASQVALRV